MKFKHRSSGFTLIELLVVIAIIGVLASIVLASLNNARIKARDVRRVTDIREIITALALIQSDSPSGAFPCRNLQDSSQSQFLNFLRTAGYLNARPRDPLHPARVYYYATFTNSTGSPCGQIAHMSFDAEGASAICPGRYHTSISGHCHIMFPRPLSCSDPWLINGGWPPTGSCAPLYNNP